jgi:hypothetical protein
VGSEDRKYLTSEDLEVLASLFAEQDRIQDELNAPSAPLGMDDLKRRRDLNQALKDVESRIAEFSTTSSD